LFGVVKTWFWFACVLTYSETHALPPGRKKAFADTGSEYGTVAPDPPKGLDWSGELRRRIGVGKWFVIMFRKRMGRPGVGSQKVQNEGRAFS